MSWKEAKEAAGEWLGQFGLGRDLFGKTVDLSDKGETLKAEGEFRRMVLQAAREKLRRRGAKDGDITLPQ